MNGGASKRSNGFQRDLISALSCAWLWVGPLRGPSRHLAPNTCQLSPWGRIVRCLQLPAAPRGTRIVRQFLPAAPRGTRIVPRNLPAAWERQESCRETFPPPGRDKNRAAKPSRRSGETRIVPRNLPAAWERQESCRETLPPFGRDKNRAAKPSRRPGETRNVPRNLPAEWFGSGNSVSSLPPSGLGQETVFLASRRVIWVKKQCF